MYSTAAKGYAPAMVESGIKRLFTVMGAGLLGEQVAESFPNEGAPMPIPII